MQEREREREREREMSGSCSKREGERERERHVSGLWWQARYEKAFRISVAKGRIQFSVRVVECVG